MAFYSVMLNGKQMLTQDEFLFKKCKKLGGFVIKQEEDTVSHPLQETVDFLLEQPATKEDE